MRKPRAAASVPPGHPLGEDQCEAVEQQIARQRTPRRTGRGRRGPGDVEQAAAGASEVPGEQRRAPRIEIRVAAEADVERLELPGGLQEQQRSVAAMVLGEGDLGPEQDHAGSTELVERSGLRDRQQPASHVERPRPQTCLGGCEGPLGSPRRIARDGDGTLQQCGCGREAAARLRPARRELQLAGDLLVRPGCGGSEMPGPTVRIDNTVGDLGQRQMGRSALGSAGSPVHGRARQGMSEGHALLQCEQSVRRVDRGQGDPQARAGALQEQRIPERLGCGDQQQATRLVGEAGELPQVARLDSLREVAGFRHPETTGQLRHGQPPRKLEERQRVAPCLREDPVAHLPVHGEPHRCAQQCASVTVDQPAHLELRQVPKLLTGLPCGEHEPHGLGQEPASDERECRRRGPIQPLRVVHDAQQGTFLGRFGQQAEYGEADQEPIRWRPRGQAEDDA